MKDVYHHPEEHGLTIVAEYDLDDEPYSFDIRCVWKDKKGRLYTASDSGCSCPSPFETYKSIKSLDRLTSMDMLKEEHRERVKDRSSRPQGWDEFRRKVAAALRDIQ